MGTLIFDTHVLNITAPCNVGSASYEITDARDATGP